MGYKPIGLLGGNPFQLHEHLELMGHETHGVGSREACDQKKGCK
jgi:hypothetical protein